VRAFSDITMWCRATGHASMSEFVRANPDMLTRSVTVYIVQVSVIITDYFGNGTVLARTLRLLSSWQHIE
jgi:hypothetical protein